ncbi:MAG: hypothetical protein WBP85_17975, partial [Terracidiphilus sp.]
TKVNVQFLQDSLASLIWPCRKNGDVKGERLNLLLPLGKMKLEIFGCDLFFSQPVPQVKIKFIRVVQITGR